MSVSYGRSMYKEFLRILMFFKADKLKTVSRGKNDRIKSNHSVVSYISIFIQ